MNMPGYADREEVPSTASARQVWSRLAAYLHRMLTFYSGLYSKYPLDEKKTGSLIHISHTIHTPMRACWRLPL